MSRALVRLAFMRDIARCLGSAIIAKSPTPRSISRYRVIDTNPRYVIVDGDKSYVDATSLNTLAAQVQVNSYFTQLWTMVAQHPHKPHLSNVYRCCPLPNLHQTNKLYSDQRVKGELNLDNKWKSDVLYNNERNSPSFQPFCMILKLS